MRALVGKATLEQARIGDCGCPEEVYLFDGVYLEVHFEPNGDADAFLDFGDDGEVTTTIEGHTRFAARLAVFAWAASYTRWPLGLAA